MKICRKCNIKKPLVDYYKHRDMTDGHLNIYKECKREYTQDPEYRERQRVSDRKRYKSKRRQEWIAKWQPQYNEKNRSKINQRKAEWKQNNPDKMREARRRYHRKVMADPIKHQKLLTRRKTRWHVKQGNIKKQPCEVCKNINVQAHHDDYADHLNVRWLCRIHNKELHKQFQRID